MPATGLEGEGLLAGLGGERLDDAAHAVAAGLRAGAVRIQDVDVVGGARRARIMDRHDLVEPGRGIGVQRNGGRRRHLIGTAAHVGNDDLVADAVHLGERGGACHGSQFRVRFGAIWRKRAGITSATPPQGDNLDAALRQRRRWRSRHREDAEHHQQEDDQNDADQDARAGGGGSGQSRHAEQAGGGGDNQKNDDPFDHGNPRKSTLFAAA